MCIHHFVCWDFVQGVLTDVQSFYDIGDGDAGLLQAIFVVGFMATSPIFGYCGDRYNRKWLMVGGIGLWSVITLAGSFIPKQVINASLSVLHLVRLSMVFF